MFFNTDWLKMMVISDLFPSQIYFLFMSVSYVCLGLSGGASNPAITSGGVSILKSNANSQPEPKRRKVLPPPDTRMVVYVRQENEEIFTPLHLVPPTVPGKEKGLSSM